MASARSCRSSSKIATSKHAICSNSMRYIAPSTLRGALISSRRTAPMTVMSSLPSPQVARDAICCLDCGEPEAKRLIQTQEISQHSDSRRFHDARSRRPTAKMQPMSTLTEKDRSRLMLCTQSKITCWTRISASVPYTLTHPHAETICEVCPRLRFSKTRFLPCSDGHI